MPKARWIGPFDAMLPDRRVLRVGDITDVSDRELESAHWEAVQDSPAAPKTTPAPAAKTSEGGDD